MKQVIAASYNINTTNEIAIVTASGNYYQPTNEQFTITTTTHKILIITLYVLLYEVHLHNIRILYNIHMYQQFIYTHQAKYKNGKLIVCSYSSLSVCHVFILSSQIKLNSHVWKCVGVVGRARSWFGETVTKGSVFPRNRKYSFFAIRFSLITYFFIHNSFVFLSCLNFYANYSPKYEKRLLPKLGYV